MQATTLQYVQVILQALSSFAIAGGLIFTAFQFRHAHKAQVVANFSRLVEMQFQLRRLHVDRPELADEQDKRLIGSDRDIQEYFVNLMQVSLFEIAWYAHRHGQLPDDYYNSWMQRMWQEGQEPSFRKMIENPSMKIMHDEFADFVRQLVQAPEPPKSINSRRF